MPEISVLTSVCTLRCPACRKGPLFANPGLFFDYSFKMNSHCPNCKESFVREPGFYYGAMFISYILSAFFSLLFVGVLIIFFEVQWQIAIGLLIVLLIITFVYLFKVSRSIWIHLFVKRKD
jgi:ABC-type multidrug transport system fused ATPase/permease subunit